MSHNTLPPSPFGAGTQYDSAGNKHIVSPESHDKLPVPPRITRAMGEKAAHVTVQTPLDIAAQQQASGENIYAGPASRQADLERAEVENIQRAAADAGMTVDQWKASRRQG